MAAAPPGPGPRPCPATTPALVIELAPGGGGAHPASRLGPTPLRSALVPARGPLAQPGAARSLWRLRCTHLVAPPKIGSKLK